MLSNEIGQLLKGEVYLRSPETDRRLFEILKKLSMYHFENCPQYRILCEKRKINLAFIESIEDLVYLPTAIFKEVLLRSIPEAEVFREIQSSATSSGRPSRIALDKNTSMRWSLSMQRMLSNRIGSDRYKTMILDDDSALDRTGVVSARASMTRSLLFSASEVETCMYSKDNLLQIDISKLNDFFVKTEKGDRRMLFGFTYILYMYVIKPLLAAGEVYHSPDMKIIHAGGWKKLQSLKVSEEQLKEDCEKVFGVQPHNVIDIYGFSEQGGMLYPTCEQGVRHIPSWGEVICRNPMTLAPQPDGEEGLMQFLTPLQTSYPGHSVLTEDVGKVKEENGCPCGRGGKTFKIIGRSQDALEERGCGDIMANMFA
jgi:phenylacetate-coenzyme A ligase PaaK-like adenylate-forming protein